MSLGVSLVNAQSDSTRALSLPTQIQISLGKNSCLLCFEFLLGQHAEFE
jgi:hypothetical protein